MCESVAKGNEYYKDLCNELCLFILEKVDNDFLNKLESQDKTNNLTGVDYFFYGAAWNKWNYFLKFRSKNTSRNLTDNNKIGFTDLDDIGYKLFNEEPDVTLEDLKPYLNDADKGFIDLFLRSNGYKRTMSDKSGIDVKSLKKYEDKLIKKIKRNV